MIDSECNTTGARAMRGREAAFTAVLAVLRGACFIQETLAGLRSRGRLRGREAALAMEVALGAVRHALTIEHVLGKVARYDARRVQPELQAVLLCGSFQIIWMDRVPTFAVVNEAVSQARRHVGKRASGMINAILRNLTRAIEQRRVQWQRCDPREIRVDWDQACRFNVDVLPRPESRESRLKHLAAATGERLARYRQLVEQHGSKAAESVAWASQAVPVTVLQRNLLRIDSGVFQSRVQETFGNQAPMDPRRGVSAFVG